MARWAKSGSAVPESDFGFRNLGQVPVQGLGRPVALADVVRSKLEARGSTRGFALLRILLIAVLFYETTKGTQIHPGYFDAPFLAQVLLTVMLLPSAKSPRSAAVMLNVWSWSPPLEV